MWPQITPEGLGDERSGATGATACDTMQPAGQYENVAPRHAVPALSASLISSRSSRRASSVLCNYVCMIVRPNSSTPAQMGSFCKFAIEPDGAAPTTAASIGLALLLVPLAPEERAVYLRPTIIEIPQFFVFNPQNNDLYVYS